MEHSFENKDAMEGWTGRKLRRTEVSGLPISRGGSAEWEKEKRGHLPC